MADVDILGPSERRRIWGAQEKAALLAEIDAEGGKLRLVARRHGISESLLYNWPSARKAAAVAAGAADEVEFVPVGVVAGKAPHRRALLASPEPMPTPEPPPADGKGGSIEIILPNGARVSGGAFFCRVAGNGARPARRASRGPLTSYLIDWSARCL